MATDGKGGIVRAIDQSTVHRICSGQVVLTLAVAVKELVENSLDSHATQIEVRLREYGSELVEVTDNGHGISTDNFEALCLKHYTSKIQEFEDLLSVETFGFRGEALSSLCALSKLSVTTCERDDPVGWKLEYDHHGKLVQQIKYSRQPGTTVSLENLFSTLPVRHKEFTRNLKREFSKMINLLTGYCLISKGTRITCTNITAGGKRNIVLSTRGGTSLKDNFTLIFGMKSWQSMLDIVTVDPSEEILLELGLTAEIASSMECPFELEGFISSCAHGQGRSCADRQYYFINGRPCDPTKVSKLVNEIYHSFNRNQYPCIVLNITTRSNLVDINVTPDKRQLMVTNEKLLLAKVKASLNQLYSNVPNSFAVQNNSILSSVSQDHNESQSESRPSPRLSLAAFAANNSWSSQPATQRETFKRKSTASTPAPKQKRLDQFVIRPTHEPSFTLLKTNEEDEELEIKCETIEEDQSVISTPVEDSKPAFLFVEEPSLSLSDVDLKELDSPDVQIIKTEEELLCVIDEILPIKEAESSAKSRITIPFNLESLRNEQNNQQKTKSESSESKQFMARIRPDDTAAAEAELNRQINQDDFEKMDIIGQFNLGFIIARLSGDLFIVDQHASDEKYNFETLQRTTRLQPQKLVCPKSLNLTAVNESLVMENLDIFRRNGFDFLIKPEEEATKRVFLTAVPTSGNWSFGPSDVDELLFMLQESPVYDDPEQNKEVNQLMMAQYRPSRVRAMFASRACRRSVMVGDPLTVPQMKKLVSQLGQLKQPWNCPHGRPTMRHLINLEMLP